MIPRLIPLYYSYRTRDSVLATGGFTIVFPPSFLTVHRGLNKNGKRNIESSIAVFQWPTGDKHLYIKKGSFRCSFLFTNISNFKRQTLPFVGYEINSNVSPPPTFQFQFRNDRYKNCSNIRQLFAMADNSTYTQINNFLTYISIFNNSVFSKNNFFTCYIYLSIHKILLF